MWISYGLTFSIKIQIVEDVPRPQKCLDEFAAKALQTERQDNDLARFLDLPNKTVQSTKLLGGGYELIFDDGTKLDIYLGETGWLDINWEGKHGRK